MLFLPRTSVILPSLYWSFAEKRLIAIMDSVVCFVRDTDQVIGIQKKLGSILYVLQTYRIHVMNYDLAVNIVSFDAEITAVVSDYYLISDSFPFRRTRVEHLVEYPVESESLFTNRAVKLEVLEPFFKGQKMRQFSICLYYQEVSLLFRY